MRRKFCRKVHLGWARFNKFVTEGSSSRKSQDLCYPPANSLIKKESTPARHALFSMLNHHYLTKTFFVVPSANLMMLIPFTKAFTLIPSMV